MNNEKYFIILSGALMLMLGCTKKDDDQQPSNAPTGVPVETNAANTTYSPAFAGQTRANGVTTNTPYQSTVITSALASPWGIAALPDGRLLITEKSGTMRIVTISGTVGNAITGIPSVNDAGQGGLLGLCLDPQFSSNRMVYWVFSENVAGGTVTAVAKGTLSSGETSIENSTVIYRANPAANSDLHYGSRILFDATGNLFVSTGERSGLSTRPLAQSVSGALGKIIRITTNGAAAAGNPVFSSTNPVPELYSIGHRNPQGLALHPTTGDLWEGEHGPRGGDEINRIQAGSNYGWPTITYGIEYSGQPIGDAIQVQNGMKQPVYYWDPVIAPCGMTFYKGSSMPEWKNNLFVCSLGQTHIARLVIQNNLVVGEERLMASENQRFRDITQSSDGTLFAITDAGRLYMIKRQ